MSSRVGTEKPTWPSNPFTSFILDDHDVALEQLRACLDPAFAKIRPAAAQYLPAFAATEPIGAKSAPPRAALAAYPERSALPLAHLAAIRAHSAAFERD